MPLLIHASSHPVLLQRDGGEGLATRLFAPQASYRRGSPRSHTQTRRPTHRNADWRKHACTCTSPAAAHGARHGSCFNWLEGSFLTSPEALRVGEAEWRLRRQPESWEGHGWRGTRMQINTHMQKHAKIFNTQIHRWPLCREHCGHYGQRNTLLLPAFKTSLSPCVRAQSIFR